MIRRLIQRLVELAREIRELDERVARMERRVRDR